MPCPTRYQDVRVSKYNKIGSEATPSINTYNFNEYLRRNPAIKAITAEFV